MKGCFTLQPTIEIVGLGAGDLKQLPLGIYELLMESEKQIFVRTKDHPVVEALKIRGLTVQSFDDLYEQATSFDKVYDRIVARLVKEVKKQSIIYAVPGHPMLAEK